MKKLTLPSSLEPFVATTSFQPIELGASGNESYGDQVYPALVDLISKRLPEAKSIQKTM